MLLLLVLLVNNVSMRDIRVNMRSRIMQFLYAPLGVFSMHIQLSSFHSCIFECANKFSLAASSFESHWTRKTGEKKKKRQKIIAKLRQICTLNQTGNRNIHLEIMQTQRVHTKWMQHQQHTRNKKRTILFFFHRTFKFIWVYALCAKSSQIIVVSETDFFLFFFFVVLSFRRLVRRRLYVHRNIHAHTIRYKRCIKWKMSTMK